jgi:hypothetical protein
VFWEFLAHSKQPTYQFLCFVLIGSHQLVSEPGVFLLNSKKFLQRGLVSIKRNQILDNIAKSKNKSLGNSEFFIITRPATRSVTKERQQEEMDQQLENMEQFMKRLSDSHGEFCKSQQTMQYRITEIYEMLAKTSNGENSHGRNHECKGENSFKFFWNEDE